MFGPVAAPASVSHQPAVAPAAAAKLAYYVSPGFRVLAPRGWHCLESSGSGGAYLLVTPEAHTLEDRQGFRPVEGPAVELLYLNGWTSGRFQVAQVLARLFPVRRAFVRSVVEEGLQPYTRFPRGPSRSDIFRRRGPAEMDYITPAWRTGMGTEMSLYRPEGERVSGRAMLAFQDGVLLLDARLPAGLASMTPVILREGRAEGRRHR